MKQQRQRAKPGTPDYKNVLMSTRIPGGLYEQLCDRANLETGGNASALIRRAIVAYLEQQLDGNRGGAVLDD